MPYASIFQGWSRVIIKKMATERIEDGEYGVEIITASTKPAEVAKPTPVAAAVAVAQTKPAAQQSESEDEEDMYGEGTSFAAATGADDGF